MIHFDNEDAIDENRKNAVVKFYRMVADLLESHPEYLDHLAYLSRYALNIYPYNEDEKTPEFVAKVARDFLSLGFEIDKNYNGKRFILNGNVKDDTGQTVGQISFNVSRESVCTPRVVGTHTVEKDVEVTAATYEKKEVEEDIIEWECHPLLSSKSE